MSVDFFAIFKYVCIKFGKVKNIMDILEVFGVNLRKYREDLGLSQEKFAEICGLHRTYISDVERFQRSISLKNVQKIADALGVKTHKLFIE